MIRKYLTIATALALVMLPAIGSASEVHGAATSPITQTYSYSLGVNTDCTLSLDTNGTISFPAVSALGNSPEATAVNNAYTTCSSASATLAISDWVANGTITDYILTTSGFSNPLHYFICPNQSGTSCYSNGSSFSVSNAGLTTTPMYGYFFAHSQLTPGTYTDLIYVTLTFS